MNDAEKFRVFFDKFAGEAEEIDAVALQRILSIAFSREFRLNVARAIVNVFDENHSGMLGYEEFLLAYLRTKECMAIFKRYDIDESGSIEAFELRQALFDAYPKLSLSQEVLQAINARFSTGDGKINVDDFVEISCRFDRFYRLVSMFLNPDGSSITLTTEQLVRTGMSM